MPNSRYLGPLDRARVIVPTPGNPMPGEPLSLWIDSDGTIHQGAIPLPFGEGGNLLLHGEGAPAPAVGTNGDFYIDTTASDLYGPKTAGAWGDGVSLIGPAGADGTDGTDGTDGADGRTVLNGEGAPGGGLGEDGDFYLDTLTYDLYGPKTAGAWGTATSLVGPAGADGTDGTDGTDGADGRTVLNGEGVPESSLGEDGDFYIDTLTYDLYGPKTAGDWGAATSLIGPAGADGDDGADGADGRTVLNGEGVPEADLGEDGDFYLDTLTYDLYGPKTAGDWGAATSLIGPAGADGADGDDGADGRTVLNGEGVPEADLGEDGDFYIDTLTYDLYGPKTAGAWGSPYELVGLDKVQTFTAGQAGEITALVDGATVAIDLADSNHFSLTIGGNRTLDNPANATPGQSGMITVTQDATGGRVLSFASNWSFADGVAPVLSTDGGAVDALAYFVISNTSILISIAESNIS